MEGKASHQRGKSIRFLYHGKNVDDRICGGCADPSQSRLQAGEIYRAFFVDFRLKEGILGVTDYGLNRYGFLLLAAACLLWLAVSVWEEKGKDVRQMIAGSPAALRWCCYYGVVLLLLITGIYGGSYDTAAFLYQSF